MDWNKLLSPLRIGQTGNIPEKGIVWRSEFEKDYDRIIFSHPFRRLQDKTQVFPLPEDDFVHTRLTHSLEVSSVAKSLGRKAGEIILEQEPELKESGFSQYDFGAITSAAALAHDIGNPPFGHAGESAISDFFQHNPVASMVRDNCNVHEWTDLINFEGNAQGFRLLSKGSHQGLSLTKASLAAFTKYPRQSSLIKIDKSRRSQKKYGFFQSELDDFQEVAETVGLKILGDPQDKVWCRHPLAFLVEAADDICYSIIDLEDGARLGLVSYETTRDLLAAVLGDRFDEKKLNRINQENERISLLRAISIGVLIDQCINVFASELPNMLSGQFDKAMTDLIPASEILSEISRISVEKIYRSRVVLETESAGFEVINGLLEKFIPAAMSYQFQKDKLTSREKSLVRLLPSHLFSEAEKDQIGYYNLTMRILDLISGMTDSHAVQLFRKINGVNLPSGFPTKF